MASFAAPKKKGLTDNFLVRYMKNDEVLSWVTTRPGHIR